MDVIEGGAILPVTDFWVGSGRSTHTSTQSGRPVAQADLDATNALQETAWQIDTSVLEVALAAAQRSHPCLGIAPERPLMPEKVGPEAWAELDIKAKAALGRERRAARDKIIGWDGDKAALEALLLAAHEDHEHDRLYFAWSHDARLRRYPRVSQGPSPQGDGLGRSLIRFADGVELGDDGLFWLRVRLGTAAGKDKLDHKGRSDWTMANMEALLAAAEDPLERDFWWKDEKGERRDDPWAVLATTWELREALSMDNPAGYLSHLPVQVDGTCNGLQHLSAMGLDPIGGLATNLGNDPNRHDIYMEVLEHVEAAVKAALGSDALVKTRDSTGAELLVAVSDLAAGWLPKLSRNLVKRATMTTPYGVTPAGIARQLMDDDLCTKEDWGDATRAAAAWMRDRISDAIGSVVVAAKDIMGWLQDTAAALANLNVPFEWTTPMGSRIRQAYHPWSMERPLTAWGRIYVASTVDRSSLKPRKQALGASPNFVHSFDAAHMAATILRGRSEGITHWSMIHDSYGTHAARMGTINTILREEFVKIYRDDWLLRTFNEIKAAHPTAVIKPPPARGSFDIEEVIHSPWFFA